MSVIVGGPTSPQLYCLLLSRHRQPGPLTGPYMTLGRRAGLVGSCVMVAVGVGGDEPEERMVVRPASVPCRAYLLALSLHA